MFCVSEGATTRPRHAPFTQTSPTVQGLLSLQTTGMPAWQVPPMHMSSIVHRFPSSQKLLLLTKAQPVRGSQLSVVQTLLSLQSTGMPPRHNPPLHVSPVVQALLSLHGA